jgi:hypothetical protein
MTNDVEQCKTAVHTTYWERIEHPCEYADALARCVHLNARKRVQLQRECRRRLDTLPPAHSLA